MYFDKLIIKKDDLEVNGNVKSVLYYWNNDIEGFAFNNSSVLSDNPVIKQLQIEQGNNVLYSYFEFDLKENLIKRLKN